MRKPVVGILIYMFLFAPLTPVFADDSISIDIVTEVEGVEVFINDQPVGATKSLFGKKILTVQVPGPGSYTLRCRLEGYNDYVRTLNVTKPQVHEVIFRESSIQASSQFQKESGSAGSMTGTIYLNTRPQEATGRIIGSQSTSMTTNAIFKSVPLGTYTIEAFFNKNNPDEYLKTEVEVREGDVIELLADFYDGTFTNNTKYQVQFISAQDEKGRLSVDGKSYGRLPAKVLLSAGTHHLTYEPGNPVYSVVDRTIDITGSGLFRIEMKQERYPVSVSLPEDAEGTLALGGTELNTTGGDYTVYMKPGVHTVSFIPSSPRYKTYSKAFDIAPNDSITLNLERANYFLRLNNGTGIAGRIFVDGKEFGKISSHGYRAGYLPPGSHSLEFSHEDSRYADWSTSLLLLGDRTIEISSLDAASYKVRFTSSPDASKLYAGGKYLGVTPVSVTLPYGNHSITLKKDGYRDTEKNITVAGDTTVFSALRPAGVTVTLKEDTTHMPYPSIQIGSTTFSGTQSDILPGNQLVKIGGTSFWFNFINTHNYEILPMFPFKQIPLATIDSLSNKLPTPLSPTLLDETKNIYKRTTKDDDLTPVQYFLFGCLLPGFLPGILGFALGGGPDAMEDPDNPKLTIGNFLGLAAGMSLGGLAMYFQGTEKVVDRTEPIPEAIEENKRREAQWETEKARIEDLNNEKLKELNTRIREENAAIRAKNSDRGVIYIKDVTSGKEFTVDIP